MSQDSTDQIVSRVVKGTLYLFATNYIQLPLSFVVNVFLARLIAPEHFGTLALASTAFSLIDKPGQIGVNQGLRHRMDDVAQAAAVHRGMSVSAGGLIVILTIALSPLLGRLYGTEVGVCVVVLATLALVDKLFFTKLILLEKELLIKRVSIVNFVAFMASSTVSITLALAGWGLWSLVGGQLGATLARAIGLTFLCPFSVPFSLDRDLVRWYLKFGPFWQMILAATATYIVLEFDDLMVGTILGKVPLGFYSLAFFWATLPTTKIAHVIGATALAAFAKLQLDRGALSRVFTMYTSVIFRITTPLVILLVVCAQEWVALLLGTQWLPMVPLVVTFGLYSMLRPIMDNTGAFYTAIGNPRIINRILFIQGGFAVVGFPTLTYLWGGVGAAVASDIVLVIGVLISYSLIRKFIDISFKRIFGPPVLASVLGLLLVGLSNLLPISQSILVRLMIKAVLFSGGYMAALVLLEGKALAGYWRLFVTFAARGRGVGIA